MSATQTATLPPAVSIPTSGWTPEKRKAQGARIRAFWEAKRKGKYVIKKQRRNQSGSAHVSSTTIKRRLATLELSDRFKMKAVRRVAMGKETIKQAAERANVSMGTIYQWKTKYFPGEQKTNGNATNRHTAIVVHDPSRISSIESQNENAARVEREHTIAAVGEVRGFLKEYAIRYNLPVQSLARRVGEILYRT